MLHLRELHNRELLRKKLSDGREPNRLGKLPLAQTWDIGHRALGLPLTRAHATYTLSVNVEA